MGLINEGAGLLFLQSALFPSLVAIAGALGHKQDTKREWCTIYRRGLLCPIRSLQLRPSRGVLFRKFWLKRQRVGARYMYPTSKPLMCTSVLAFFEV